MIRTFAALMLCLIILQIDPFHVPAEDMEDLSGDMIGIDPIYERRTLTAGLMGTRSLIENMGQIDDDDVKFYYPGDPQVLIRSDGIHVSSVTENGMIGYSMELEGGNSGGRILTGDEGTTFNFIMGSDPSEWVLGARSFNEITVEQLRPGMDLRVLVSEEGPKWEIELEKGALIDDLTLVYSGDFQSSWVKDRTIMIEKGTTSLRDGPVIIFQNGSPIDCELSMKDGHLRFNVPDYDPKMPMIIDPLMSSSTLIGGNQWDIRAKVKAHPTGDIIVAGSVESTNMKTHSTAYDRSQNGEDDLFVCRLSADLSMMRYGTYIGGTKSDVVHDLTIDDDGYVYLVGQTSSTDFPRTTGALINSFQGGGSDGFIVKVSPDLGSLNFSTYFGGSGKDWASGIEVDSTGIPFVCGSSQSTDLPSTSGCYQSEMTGIRNGFVAKVHSNGKGLHYLTYLGGSGFGDDIGDIQIDSGGKALVVGYSRSSDFPTTSGVFKTGSGNYMGFVSRLSIDGSDLDMSTFLAYGTRINGTAIDDQGNIFLTGRTETISGEFPVSSDAFDKDLSGDVDGFITKMDSLGENVLKSTYIGANELYGQPPDVQTDYIESCTDITLDDEGNVLVTGMTDSINFPLTLDAFDKTRNNLDAYLLYIDPDLTTLLFSTFIGGYDEDKGFGVAVDNDGYMYVSGHTYSDQTNHDFPTTVGAFQEVHASQYDWFCMRFKMDSFLPGPPENLTSVANSTSVHLNWEPPLFDGNEEIIDYHIYWGLSPVTPNFLTKTSDLMFDHDGLTKGKTYYYEVKANNSVGKGIGAKTSATPLSAPISPRINKVSPGDSHVNISWSPPWDMGGTPEVTYEMLYGEDPNDLENHVIDILKTYHYVSGLINGNTYYFQIFARNIIGISEGSDVINATPLGLPSTPLNFITTAMDKSVLLEWEEPLDLGGSPNVTYNIYRFSDETFSWSIQSGWNDTSFRITGLLNGKSYTYYITAKNPLGESERTDLRTVIPLGPISEPFHLKGEEYGTWVSLSWTRPNSTGGKENITYSVLMGDDPYEIEPIVNGITSTNQTVLDLVPGRTYYFSVKAFNGIFTSSGSNIISLRPLELPTKPLDLEFERGDSFINLTWKEPEYLGGDTSVRYSIHMGDSITELLSAGRSNIPQFNLTGLENGRNYFVSVRAGNSKGEGPFSNIINSTPMKIPSEPRNFIYKDDDRKLEISWDSPFDHGGSEWVVYNLYLGDDQDEMILIAADLTTREYTLEGLVNGRLYYIGITAVNPMGESEMAGPYEAVPMTTPGSPRITNITVTNEGLMINWEAPMDNGGSGVWYYHIKRTDDSGKTSTFSIGGHVLQYLDIEVLKGKEYSYTITAETSYGKGEPSDPMEALYPEDEVEEGFSVEPMMMIAAAAAVLIILILLGIFAFTRSRKRRRERKMWEE